MVEAELAAIRRNLEHIVGSRIDRAGMDGGGALRKFPHHSFLEIGRLGDDVVVNRFRGGKVELVGGLDVGGLFPELHQLRQVEEFGEARPRPVSGSFGGQFDACRRFPERAGPAVEMREAPLFERVVLEVAHHRVQLGHTVGNRRSGGEHDAPVVGDFVDVPAFEIHVAGFLRVGGGQPGDVAHLGV